MEYTLTLIGGAVAALLLLRTVYLAYVGGLDRVPGPLVSLFVPFRFEWESIRGDSHIYIHSLHEKYGPIVRVSPSMVVVADAAYAKQVYKTPTTYLKTRFYDHLLGGVQNVFSMRRVQDHAERRRLLAGPMSESSLRLMEARVQGKVDTALARMAEDVARDGYVDAWKWNHALAVDVITDLTLGESVGVLNDGYQNEYVKDFERVIRATAGAAYVPWFFNTLSRLLGMQSGPAEALGRVMKHSRAAFGKYDEFVKADYERAMQSPTVFTRMLKAKEADKLGDDEMVTEVQAFTTAGGDTTSTSLSCLMWAVAKQPRIQARLVAELRALDDLSNQSLKGCDYLNHVVEETLRLYGAGNGWWPRAVPAAGDRFGDHHVPGGTTIAVSAYTMHRDPHVFPDPLRFSPERWERPTQAMKDSFLPWGGGSRVCIGLNLAKMEMRLMTAVFYLAFPKTSISEKADPADMEKSKNFIAIAPAGRKALIRVDERAMA